VVKYLGSKRRLLGEILEAVRTCPGDTVLDLFSGTSRVGHCLKQNGYRVLANDINTYAYNLALCYVQADAEEWSETASKLIEEYNQLPGEEGFITRTYCEEALYFQRKNGMRIDAIREAIEKANHPPELKAILITSLIEAADRVDSTTGVQMAYLKEYSERSANDLELRLPKILPKSPAGKCAAHQLDAALAAKSLSADIAYLDPPYNQHSYLGNYHIWETITLWDKPKVYGIAKKRTDVRDRASRFNSKVQFKDAFTEIIQNLDCRSLIVSFNNEGFLTAAEIEEVLSSRGSVTKVDLEYERYIGAKIGIHNHKGERTGTVRHTRNVEHLFIVQGS
jgi:adenine-specific DNA-methyltransferase